jgi:hypothetical protein
MKTHTKFQQSSYAASNFDVARGRHGRAADDFQQGALAGTVDAYNPYRLSPLYL